MANSHDIFQSTDGIGIAVERIGDASVTLWSDVQASGGHFVTQRAAPKRPRDINEGIATRLAAVLAKRLAQ